jgi:hypothetical protein
MAFADILKTFKKPQTDNGGILGKMDRYLLSLNGERMRGKPENRAKNCFHPSELSTNGCIRSMVYKWLNTPATNQQTVQARGRRIFDTGHHYGYILQQYFWDMDILEGKYEATCCGHEWWAISPRQCPNCGKELEIWKNLFYLEVPIQNKKWNIIGHSDGILNVAGERILIELKSIKNRDAKTSDKAVTFEDLQSAKLEHVYQTNLYMDALDEEFGHGGKYIDRAIIIYFAKNTQEMKEFPIFKMDMMLSPSYTKINQVNQALHEGYLPERAGRIKSDPTCRYCSFKDYCWDNDHSFSDSDKRVKEIASI